LIDQGPQGAWAQELFGNSDIAAPHLMPVEVANILRLSALAGDISQDVASIAHADLLQLPVELYPYEILGPRVWELRQNVSAHDAWYVALAEALGAPLATLDGKLAQSTGPRCEFTMFQQG
jgi:predicted nucleic acid-binding protein